MKKLLFIPLIWLAGASFAQEAEFRIGDLSGGMHSYQSPNNIPDNAAAYIQNFLTDEDRMALERNGFIKKETTQLGGVRSVIGLWRFLDTSENEWLIAFSSKTFWRSKTGTAFERFGLLASNENFPDCAVNLGLIMCVNGTDAAWTFNGTSTAVVSGAPIGRLIEPWRTRFAIADITSARSTIRFSEDGLSTNWVIGSSATAPYSRLISGTNDGQPVRCLRGSYLDNMVIMRKNDTWSLSGFDQSDDVVRKISSEIGCVSDRTVQELDGSLYWLSNRGVEKRTGNTIELISEPIRNIADEIVARVISSEKSNTQTSAGDWDAGTKTSTDSFDTITVSGDLTAKTFANTLTTRSDFSGGDPFTGNDEYVDINSVEGTIRTMFPEEFDELRIGLPNVRDEFGGVNNAVSGGNLIISMANYNTGGLKSAFPIENLLYGTTFNFQIQSLEDDIGFQFCLNTSSATTTPDLGTYWCFSTGFEDISDYPVSWQNSNLDAMTTRKVGSFPMWSIYISTSSYIISAGTQTTTGSHSWSNNLVTMYLRGSGEAVSLRQAKISHFRMGPQYFVFTSSAIDMDYGTGDFDWGKFYDTSYSSGTSVSTITYQVATSSNNSTFTPYVTVTSDTVISASKFRYIKERAVFYQNDAAQNVPLVLYDMSAPAYSSGTYQSQTINLGGIPTAFGAVQISETDADEKITYQFNASTDSVYFNPSSWTSISHGGVPTNGVNQYAAFKASFTITNATNVATLHYFTVNWIDGSSNPLSSTIWDRRYVLSYSTTNSSPDKTLVWQRNNSWTLFDGINAASYAEWANGIYFGNSDNTGYVYQLDIGQNDDGANIESKINFKSYDATVPSKDKDFRSVYASFLGNTAHSGSFSASYQLDRDGNSYSLGIASLNEGTGQETVKFPFPLSNSVRGREIRYVIEKTGTANRLRLYDLVTVYEVKESP